MNDSGWESSAAAWIGHLGPQGDRGRRYVLDPAMRERFKKGGFARALDVGCGEGRVCRMLAEHGIHATGIDPTEALITHAKELDKTGDYRIGRAEALLFEEASFDLVISCLSLIDIADYRAAIGEMARVLEPGGTLLAVNLTSFMSAGGGNGWRRDTRGRKSHFGMDEYMHERADWIEFSGLRIENWHRPLSDYMSAYLDNGLHLTHFDEPAPINAPADFERHYLRAPFFNLMEWRKPT
jgi:SAM-dependent methyltransferase